MLWKKLRLTLEMIKFEHSVFALPFALTGALLAFRESGFDAARLGWKLAWIVVAMVGARSAAMAFNRLVDAEIDARNPRTKMRHMPAGTAVARLLPGASSLVGKRRSFCSRRGELNPLCFRLAPLALAVVFFYSFTKRFTSFSHLVLGFALGIAPAAAWIAVRGSLDPRILWLTAAVTFWTAGFDIIYSCQDYEFDCGRGLYSVPRALGIARRAARGAGAARADDRFACWCWFISLHLGGLALAGVAAVPALLIYEHSLVKPNDLSRVNAAFFTMNGWVSVLFFVFWAADIFLLHPSYLICQLSSKIAVLMPIREKVEAGERLSFDDGVALYRTSDILALGYMANLVRERLHGDITYFNVNRHINPTDVCVASCRLCAFGKQRARSQGLHHVARRGVASRGRRLERGRHRVPHRRRTASGTDSRLVLPDAARPEAALPAGAPEGLHDGGDRILRAAREDSACARRWSGCATPAWIRCPAAARRFSTSACGASSATTRSTATSGWKPRAPRIELGLHSNCTMLYGHIENEEDRADHLVRLRELAGRDPRLRHLHSAGVSPG